MLQNTYHDGTNQRALIVDGVNTPASIRSWKLSKRLPAADAIALRTFWEQQNGGLTPFYFYDPFEPAPGHAVGSNFDPTGLSIQGRHTCVFRGNWTETVGLPFTEAAVEIAEVA